MKAEILANDKTKQFKHVHSGGVTKYMKKNKTMRRKKKI